MSWTWVQKSGRLLHDDAVVASGYAGRYTGKNNPKMQAVVDTGPLPCGVYRIDDSYTHPELGPITMDLKPDVSNEMFGRSLFRIHGDSPEHFGMASKGCIVLAHDIRTVISKAVQDGDRMLEVIAEEA